MTMFLILLIIQLKKLIYSVKTNVIDFVYAYGNVNDTFGYHMIALTKRGRINGWGMNTYKLVSQSEDKERSSPKSVSG